MLGVKNILEKPKTKQLNVSKNTVIEVRISFHFNAKTAKHVKWANVHFFLKNLDFSTIKYLDKEKKIKKSSHQQQHTFASNLACHHTRVQSFLHFALAVQYKSAPRNMFDAILNRLIHKELQTD